MQHMYHEIVFGRGPGRHEHAGPPTSPIFTITLKSLTFSSPYLLQAGLALTLFVLYHRKDILKHMYQYAIYPSLAVRRRSEIRGCLPRFATLNAGDLTNRNEGRDCDVRSSALLPTTT